MSERWTVDAHGCHWTRGKHCAIWIGPRPPYCDRGNWLAHVDTIAGTHPLDFSIDFQDGWPRYYFDLERAKAECEAWLTKRGEV